jgi:hypothetical protein
MARSFEGLLVFMVGDAIMTVEQATAKTGYTAPKLVVYGAMAALTAGGSGNSAEGSMTTDLTRQRP